jgi:Holliday junction resolvase
MPSHIYRNDGNQSAIVKALQQAKVRVTSTAKIGGGHPDVVGYCPMTGVFALLEIKMPREKLKLRPSQIKWRMDHPDLAYYTKTVDSVGMALRAFKLIA